MLSKAYIPTRQEPKPGNNRTVSMLSSLILTLYVLQNLLSVEALATESADSSKALPAPSPDPSPSPDPIPPPRQTSKPAEAENGAIQGHGPDSPAQGNEKQEELPPLAPQFNAENQVQDLPSQNSQAPVFNLQAQQYDLRAQDNLRIGRQLNPAYGQGQPGQPLSGYAVNNGLNTNTGQTNNSGRTLTQVDLQKLAAHDVVLIIDRSASMSIMDCPSGKSAGGLSGIAGLTGMLGIPFMSTSRWDWCLKQTSELARETEGIYRQGITIVLFSTGFMTFDNVSMQALPEIFARNYPAGGTNLAPALASQIGSYLRRREYTGGNVKPLMIGIITDGCPTSKQAVKSAIIDATRLMRNPNEITIIFFLIGGMDFAGSMFVKDLSTNLVYQGAAFPIVREVSFSELQRTGLAKAIADNLK